MTSMTNYFSRRTALQVVQGFVLATTLLETDEFGSFEGQLPF